MTGKSRFIGMRKVGGYESGISSSSLVQVGCSENPVSGPKSKSLLFLQKGSRLLGGISTPPHPFTCDGSHWGIGLLRFTRPCHFRPNKGWGKEGETRRELVLG